METGARDTRSRAASKARRAGEAMEIWDLDREGCGGEDKLGPAVEKFLEEHADGWCG